MTDVSLARAQVELVRPPDPEGRLRILLTVVDGHIVMDFGRAVWWVGLTPEEGQKLMEDLQGAVRTARTLHVPPGGGINGTL